LSSFAIPTAPLDPNTEFKDVREVSGIDTTYVYPNYPVALCHPVVSKNG
jgi:hypothetical protein